MKRLAFLTTDTLQWVLSLALIGTGGILYVQAIFTPDPDSLFAEPGGRMSTPVRGAWNATTADGVRDFEMVDQARRRSRGSGPAVDPAGPGERDEPDDLPPAPVPEGPREIRYEVQEGDSLWVIARKLLGSGAEWEKLLEMNPGLDRELIRPGDIIKVIRPGSGDASIAQEPEESRDAEVVESETPPRDPPGAGGQIRVHVVEKGESLYTIARQYRPRKSWEWLYEANREVIPRPDLLRPGTHLRVPVGM